MTPRYHPMIQSLEDITRIQRPVFMVQKHSSHEEAVLVIQTNKCWFNRWCSIYIVTSLKGANSGVLSKIGDSLRKYPELSLKTKTAYDEAPELVVKQQKVFGAIKAVLLAIMERDLKKTGQCRLYLANKPWGEHLSAFGLPKFSPIILIFNRE